MLIVLGILSAGLLGLIIYFAFSPKSSRFLKLAAIIALGLIGISLGVCSILIVIGPSQDANEIPFPIFSDSPPAPARKGNIFEIFTFLAVLSFIITLIILLARRSHRKKGEAASKKEQKSQVFESSDELDDLDIKTDLLDDQFDDDDFNMKLD